ncbi:MAG: Cys-rich peptide radical SAM maturase CcpM [Clostridia bacterium]|nr:Cys-rich peptide radical SAM maturase CcpM [Clostridia bacterium]
MNSELPFVHLFKNINEYYLYDVNKHKILNIPEEVYNLLLKQKETGDKVQHPLIAKMMENGYLSSNRVVEMLHSADPVLEDYLNSKVERMVLQVTQQCNFRCAYCVYSGEYTNRKHANNKMSLEVAKKAIDFLISHSRDSSSIDLGFYGGEPLLEFDLIKNCIEYFEKKAEGKAITISITCNGSLISEEIIEYFQNHNVTMSISIDGPKEVHDKNRKFAGSGCGTFDKVQENLIMIRKKYPEYAKSILYSMVIDPTLDLSCINQFVATEEYFDDVIISTSIISSDYKKDKINYTEDFISKWEYNKFRFFLAMLGRIDDGNLAKFVKISFKLLYDFMETADKYYPEINSKDHHSGPCVPGQTRLFVNVNGDLFPCERVSEDSEAMKIGNIYDGFSFDKARAILNIGKLTEDNCRDCFAFRRCTLCASHADVVNENTSELSKEKKLSACLGVRQRFEQDLKDYCTLKRLGYDINRDVIRIGEKNIK